MDRFDDVFARLDGLPGVKMGRPASIQEGLPLLGDVSTITVQTARVTEHDDAGRVKGSKLVTFLTYQDSDRAVRLVLPDKAVRTIVRQHAALFDTSTPESRRRKAKQRENVQRRQRDHAAGKHNRETRIAKGVSPYMRGCPDCDKAAARALRAVS